MAGQPGNPKWPDLANGAPSQAPGSLCRWSPCPGHVLALSWPCPGSTSTVSQPEHSRMARPRSRFGNAPALVATLVPVWSLSWVVPRPSGLHSGSILKGGRPSQPCRGYLPTNTLPTRLLHDCVLHATNSTPASCVLYVHILILPTSTGPEVSGCCSRPVSLARSRHTVP